MPQALSGDAARRPVPLPSNGSRYRRTASTPASTPAWRSAAALAVNTELLQLYWQLGRDLSDRRQEWGTGVIDQVSANLRAAFPEMQGRIE